MQTQKYTTKKYKKKMVAKEMKYNKYKKGNANRFYNELSILGFN